MNIVSFGIYSGQVNPESLPKCIPDYFLSIYLFFDNSISDRLFPFDYSSVKITLHGSPVVFKIFKGLI